MKKYLLAGLGTLLLASGCKTDQDKVGTSPQIDPESPEIRDVEGPKIQTETFVAAGDLAATRGQFDVAAEQYKKALAGHPNDPKLIRKLALAQVKAGKLTQAIETWKKYVAVSNGSAEAYGSLGFAYELSGNPSEAEKTYLEGIQKNPTGQLVQVNYGLMLVRQNKVDQAVEHLSAVLKPHEVNYNIGSVYEQLHRKDLAQFYYKRSLECNPDFAAAKQKLASITE